MSTSSIAAANSSSSSGSSKRITGLSGFDTETIIQNLIKADKVPLDKLKQKREKAEWTRDAYREMTTLLQSFKSEFMDITNPASYMLSQNTYKKYTGTSSDSTIVTVSGNSASAAGSHKIHVNRIATADKAVSSGTTSPVAGTVSTLNLSNTNFNITLDGATKNISLSDYTADNIESGIQTLVDDKFGSGRISVAYDSGTQKLSFSTIEIGSKMTFTSGSAAGTSADALGSLGITSGTSNFTNVVTDPLTSSSAISNFNLSGRSFNITLDGVTKNISIDSNYSSDTIKAGIQTLVDKAFGSGKIIVSYDSSAKKLSFDTSGGASKITLTKGTGDSGDALGSLGFASGASNRINTAMSLDAASSLFKNNLTFSSAGTLKFTINSKTFEFSKSTSIATMMSTISSDSTAKVNMSYDDVNDEFVLTAKQLGAGDNIVIDQPSSGGNFFGTGGASGISTGSAATEQGVDAEAEIDGMTITRGTNSLTVNGTTYNLLKAQAASDASDITVSLATDTDTVYKNVKNFVDKYNTLIAKINDKISEKYDRDYQPLTDDQKESMTDDQITKWETKAKTGLLRNDSTLQNALYSMRRALSESVTGVDGNLASIGISTSAFYSENGKLIIDEDKLKSAISNDPDKVMNLFSKSSSIDMDWNSNMTSEQKTQRYKEEGLAYRISDILDENIRTTSGKGLLLQKAGIVGDTSEYDNTLYDSIKDYTDKIDDMEDKLEDKEQAYYTKYSKLETYISKMNTQSSWLSQQFGSSSGS